jgi:hypothetical protein
METEAPKRKRVTQGRKPGGKNCARTHYYSIHAKGRGKLVEVSAKSPQEAEEKGKNFCTRFGYFYSHLAKDGVPQPGSRSICGRS